MAVLVFSRVFGYWNAILAGNAAMAAMLVFTAVGHFVYPGGMVLMLPGIIPFKTTVIDSTAALEIIAAIGLLIPATRGTTALLLMLFFIMILPANIHAAIKKVDLEKPIIPVTMRVIPCKSFLFCGFGILVLLPGKYTLFF